MNRGLRARALSVLAANDRVTYTVPSGLLYPFQWNWDSCFVALALQTVGSPSEGEDRAWRELETLTRHQWTDGMIPHIVFHTDHDGYFPGPSFWGTECSSPAGTPTSGITQPPVLGLVLEQLWSRSSQDDSARLRCRALVEAVNRWHRWFGLARDPQATGLVSILHPWEAGRDNSVDFDRALASVPITDLPAYERRDTTVVAEAERPTDDDYDRYIALVVLFRGLGWDAAALHDASPFRVVDPGFNAILLASDRALARLGPAVGHPEIGDEAARRAAIGLDALSELWSPDRGQFVCRDRRSNLLVDNASIGGLLPVLVLDRDDVRLHHLCTQIEEWLQLAPFGVASQHPADAGFDPQRYWRGPTWLITNHLLAMGLRRTGRDDLADRIAGSSRSLLERSGFAEYYDPLTGAGLGGSTFSWTAAMAIELSMPHPSPLGEVDRLGDREPPRL